MTPFVEILSLIEKRGEVRRTEFNKALPARTAENALAQLRERGDIRLVARGVYAFPCAAECKNSAIAIH